MDGQGKGTYIVHNIKGNSMARVMIDDRWLKDAPDGTPPSREAKRRLANAKDPLKAAVPQQWRTTTFGRGKRWRCRWYVTVGGRRVQKSRSFARLREAEEYAAAMEDDIRAGRYRDPHADLVAFEQARDAWLAAKRPVLKPGTYGRYEREVRVYLEPMWGGKALREFTADALQEWVNSLSVGGYPAALPGGRASRPLKAASIRNIVRVVLGGILETAVARGWIQSNPLDQVTTPKGAHMGEDMVFLTVPEVELLASAAESAGTPVDGLLIRWQAYTGCRIGETTALLVGDVDLEARRAHIRRTWAVDEHGDAILGSPKSGKSRSVAIPRSLIGPVRALCEGRLADEWLFTAPRGGNIWVANWRSRIWSKVVRAACMEDEGVTIHSLRHTYASMAIAAGADVRTLQAQLGHSSPSITLDRYAGLWPERLDAVADAVDAARLAAMPDTIQTR